MGEITLPATPQRIVVLEWTYVEDLLAIGVQPTGVADIEGYNAWVKVPVALSPDVVDVGTRQDPNLEAIATLDPDLIIATAFRVTESYDELSAIAPTLVFDNYPNDVTHYEEMRQTFTTIADIVGRQREGEAVLAEMEAKFAAARAQLEAAGKAGEKFALAQAFSNDNQAQIRLFTDNALATQVVEQLGLENGWEDAPQQYGFSTVSVEALPELGDLHFFYVVQNDDNVFVSDAVTPLWENLEFVKNGHAYPLGGDTWLFGGPLSVSLLVDIIMGALVPDQALLPDMDGSIRQLQGATILS
jgi:iron complex transport system substrate-binding protein